MPRFENVAVVEIAAALPNTTVPGPLTFVHCVDTPVPGRPSSETVPVSVATVVGVVIVWSAPALTDGARLIKPVTVTVTVSVVRNSPSDADSVRTYDPACENEAEVTALAASPNVTEPGPLVF